MKVAIIQSNYLPWKGYFDIINMADVFVIYDSVQFSRYNWRNRNLIKTNDGIKWITIPVHRKSQKQKINEIRIANNFWKKKHWKSIKLNYCNAKYFPDYEIFFEDLYLNCRYEYLSQINFYFMKQICNLLSIDTHFVHDNELYLHGKNTNETVINYCKHFKADTFISGQTAREYIDLKQFRKNGINVEWMDYSDYPEYKQLFPPFDHNVSIIDLIFNTGHEAKKYMKSFRKKEL